MTRRLTILAVLLAGRVCQGGLTLNPVNSPQFAASFALYKQYLGDIADFDSSASIDGVDFLMWQRGLARSGQFINPFGDANTDGQVNQVDLGLWQGQYLTTPSTTPSQAFALYCEPLGIAAGSVTVVIDVPNTFPGLSRLILDGQTRLIDVHPGYTAQIQQASIQQLPGRQRLEARVSFNAKNPTDPPGGSVTIFGLQTIDHVPQLGLQDIQLAFDFRPGDFVSTFNPDTGTGRSFNDTQLTDVTMPVMTPLVLDVNTVTGAASIRTSTTAPSTTQINYYEITSESGSLNPGGWVSFDDGENGDPPGVGWEEAGGASSRALAESNLSGSLSVGPSMARSLGNAFKKSGIHDLRFLYGIQGCLIPGEIHYITPSPAEGVPEPGGIGLALIALAARAVGRPRARPMKTSRS